MNKFVVLLFLVGFVKVSAQEVTTTSAEPASSEEVPGNETSHEGHRHKFTGSIGKENLEKIKEIFEKNQTKEERVKAIDNFVKSLNETQQKHTYAVIKRFEKVKELEDKLSVEAKAALQKIKNLKKQEFEIFKGLSKKHRKELGHVIRAAQPQPPHHKQGKGDKRFKRHSKKSSKHGPKHEVTGEPEGTTEAQPEITTAAV
uniref:DUF148 domain-containing protein n=1 Tax=Acrobeloides nanus TaxID=290746 RepID=A0A914ELL6_9BILA